MSDIELSGLQRDISFGGFVIIWGLVLSYFYLGEDEFLNWFDVLGSIALSALLATLYYRQTTLQEEQQDFQRELEQARLHVDDVKQVDDKIGSLSFNLTNTGRSAAANLKLEITTGFSQTNGDCDYYESLTIPTPLHQSEEENWLRSSGEYLRAGNRGIFHPTTSSIFFSWRNLTEGSNTNMTWGGLEDQLSELQEGLMRVKGEIVYTGPTGERVETEVFDRVVEIQHRSLETAITTGRRNINDYEIGDPKG